MAYVDIDEFKTYIGLDITDDDALITLLMARAKSLIDGYTRTVFDVSADSTRYFTYGQSTCGRTLTFDTWLASAPTTVTNGDTTTVASTQYVLEPTNSTPYYAIKLTSASSIAWTYEDAVEQAISITGKWGWSATPPDEIVHAATRLTAYMYRQKDQAVMDQTAFTELGPLKISARIPTDVRDVLDRYKFIGGYFE